MAAQIISKLKRSLQGNGPRYERLERLEDGYEKESSTGRRSPRHLKPVLIVTACLLTIYLFILPGHEPAKTAVSHKESLPPAYLRVVLPVRTPDTNLCKTLLSGAILNYPEPVLVGFQGKPKKYASVDPEEDLDLEQLVSRKSNVLDIDKHLRNISTSRDEDIIVIADGLNTWFQLRPQTLLDRYFDSNRKADERIRKELGKTADNLKLRQTVLFASQKDCSPWNAEDPACSEVPESTLPNNVYGPDTDLQADGGMNPFSKQRPRYLNPGFAIGTLAALRKLYAEAARRSLSDPRLQSAEGVLGQIYGEQEAARNLHRLQTMSPIQRLFAWASTFWESASAVAEKQAQQLREADLSKEFGIGLDYEDGLSFETSHSEDDVAWLKFSDPTSAVAVSHAHGIKDSRITTLQSDIAASLPPFWTFSEEPLPRSYSWENVSLLTNIWTGVTPAIIQHDRHHYHNESLREAWWPNVWYQKYARKLFDVHIQAPIGPLALSGYDAESQRQWWGPEDWKGGARNTTKFWWRYEDICTGTEKEVFRDKKGPWYLPANH